MSIERVEEHGPVAMVVGAVEGGQVIVGQKVAVVSSNGVRDTAVVSGVLSAVEGGPVLDIGQPGDTVKVILRRREPLFPNHEIASLEALVQA